MNAERASNVPARGKSSANWPAPRWADPVVLAHGAERQRPDLADDVGLVDHSRAHLEPVELEDRHRERLAAPARDRGGPLELEREPVRIEREAGATRRAAASASLAQSDSTVTNASSSRPGLRRQSISIPVAVGRSVHGTAARATASARTRSISCGVGLAAP